MAETNLRGNTVSAGNARAIATQVGTGIAHASEQFLEGDGFHGWRVSDSAANLRLDQIEARMNSASQLSTDQVWPDSERL